MVFKKLHIGEKFNYQNEIYQKIMPAFGSNTRICKKCGGSNNSKIVSDFYAPVLTHFCPDEKINQ